VWLAHYDTSLLHTPALATNVKVLSQQVITISERAGGRKVTIVAHSMGGLLTRACLARADCKSRVRAVYTLGTPHAGFNSLSVLKLILKMLEKKLPVPITTGVCEWQRGVCDMAADQMAWFNLLNPNQPAARYAFIGGDSDPDPSPVKDLVRYIDGKHDGLVGRHSAVGWLYPSRVELPPWTSPSPAANLKRVWTSETHIDTWGNSYYESISGNPSRLSFDGDDIRAGGQNGPYALTNLALLDTDKSGVPMDMASGAWQSEPWSWFEFGSYRLGDCNGDDVTDAGDIAAMTLEIFDGDGSFPELAQQGAFTGFGRACDANIDDTIDAGDLSCLPRLVFDGPGACTVGVQ
jgi:pimeloyl-ACP methyl ester carboxylesterase